MSYHDAYVPQEDVLDKGEKKKMKLLKLSIESTTSIGYYKDINILNGDGTDKKTEEIINEVLTYLKGVNNES